MESGRAKRGDAAKKAPGPHYAGHRARLRKRLVMTRGEGLHEYEALELLLAHAIPRRDVKPLAKALIARFGGLAEVFDAEPAELGSVAGMGPVAVSLVLLVRTLMVACSASGMRARDWLSSPGAAVKFARAKLAGAPRERFMVILLNAKNEVIGHEVLHEGTVDRAAVYPRRIVEAALAARASGLVLVHNHPSGHTEPSAEDRAITRSIVEACRTVDVRVLDHVVVGRGGHFSLAEEGML